METQRLNTAKTSKVTVPFYSTPSRHYGQTSVEIIREARAAVMNSPMTRPVPTTRPFTPKDKERTLFGNVKRTDRPPSSFSLSYLHEQDTASSTRIKLPSIPGLNRVKAKSSTARYRDAVSLDNLNEDYEAEFSVDTKHHSRGKSDTLPVFRKSYSCPQERIASSNGGLPREDALQAWVHPQQGQIYLNATEYNTEQHTACTTNQEAVKVQKLKPLKGGTSSRERSRSREHSNITSPESSHDLIATTESTPSVPANDMEVELQSKEEPELADEQANEEPRKEEESKAVVTEPRCDYLYKMTKASVKASTEKHKDIVELYETARYYGVVLDDSKNIVSSVETESNDKGQVNTTNHLDNLRANMNKINDKMLRISGSVEQLEKKLSLKKNQKIMNDNEINEAKAKRRDSKAKEQGYVMNDNKRYHVSGGEMKAYRKWTKSQPQQETDKDNGNTGSEQNGQGWDFFWKNTYFRSNGEEDRGLKYINDHIEGLDRLLHSGCDESIITSTASTLYASLKSSGRLTTNGLENSFKAKLLKIVYKFADYEDPSVLLSLARIIFALRVDSSLPAAFKMVFKVSRSDANDELFATFEDILELFVDTLGLASPLDAPESFIYGYGALKFLTMNPVLLSRILHLGALDLITLHMKMVNSAVEEGNGNIGEQTKHAIFQLTGTLRNIASGQGVAPLFITTNCVSTLCKLLQLFRGDEDIVTNVARILSLLSTEDEIVQRLVDTDKLLDFTVDLIHQYQRNDKILIRLSYTLGNVVALNDLARVQLSRSDKSISTLLSVLQTYMDKDLSLSASNKDDAESQMVDDVIVKVIRIMANMSMNPVVGRNLAPSDNNKNSLQLAALLGSLTQRKDSGMTLLATLGCLNNISYYTEAHSSLVDVTLGVCRVLNLPSEESQAEAARVLGNLTRHKEIRELIYTTGVLDRSLALLETGSCEVVRSICGVLVNMLLDSEPRLHFIRSRGLDRLVDMVDRFPRDWPLASLACRAIWNSCADDVSSIVEHNNMEHLLTTLANSLDDEKWQNGDIQWEEFAVIATDLLEKINYQLETR